MDVQPTGAGYDGEGRLQSRGQHRRMDVARSSPKSGRMARCGSRTGRISSSSTTPRRASAAAATRPRPGVGGAHENDLRDHSRGRIYRVVWRDAKEPRSPAEARIPQTPRNWWPLWAATSRSGASPPSGCWWRAKHDRCRGAAEKAGRGQRRHRSPRSTRCGRCRASARSTRPRCNAALLAKDARLRRNAVRALAADAAGQKLVFRLRRGQRSRSGHAPRRAGEAGRIPHHAGNPDAGEKAGRGCRPTKPTNGCAKPPASSCSKHKAEAPSRKARTCCRIPALKSPARTACPKAGSATTTSDAAVRSMPRQRQMEDDRLPAHSGAKAVTLQSAGDELLRLYAEVPLKPNTEYRLSGWVKTANVSGGKVGLSDHLSRTRPNKSPGVRTGRSVETTYNSGSNPKASIKLLPRRPRATAISTT